MQQQSYDFSVSSSRTGSSAPSAASVGINWNNLLLATVLGISTLGTAGNACAITRKPVSQTSGIPITLHDSSRRREDQALLLPEQKINAVRRYLSLNVSDLAVTLRVARPTVYAWLRGEAEPHGGNLARIQQLYRIARVWRSVSEQPVGSFLKTSNEDGMTLLNQLSEEAIDEAAIRETFEQIRTAMIATSKRESITEMARSRGLAPVQRGMQKWTDDSLLNH